MRSTHFVALAQLQSVGVRRPLAHGRRPSTLAVAVIHGYTFGMKTAVSLPDHLFQEAEQHARRTQKSRSQLYAEALEEYLARHAPDEVTERMNRAVAQVAAEHDRFPTTAARRVLERSEW